MQTIHSNIVLSGGATLTKGLTDRIQNDLMSVYYQEFTRQDSKVHAPANRAVAAWVGGSMMASIETFQKLSIKRSEYDEHPEVDKRLSLICRRTI